MNIILTIFGYIFIMIFSWKVTGWVYHYAVNNAILDLPNHRSLHSEPTPRGGGLSIIIPVLLGATGLWINSDLSLQVFTGLAGGCLIVSIIGWLEDRTGLPVIGRAMFYLFASIWAVYWISKSAAADTTNNIVITIAGIFAIAWLTNLFNFMDGSDGLAGTQAILTGLVTTILLFYVNEMALAMLALLLAASVSGFLIWNWPPAKIFMGDVGSCLLGFAFGSMGFISFIDGTLSPAVWLILLSVFICDTTLTLLKRVMTGKRWYRAHREHAYQKVIQMGMSHEKLNYYVLLINLILLCPMTFLAFQNDAYKWWLTGSVYCLLSGIWLLVQIKYSKYPHDDSQYV